jgi:hypothetical protein
VFVEKAAILLAWREKVRIRESVARSAGGFSGAY